MMDFEMEGKPCITSDEMDCEPDGSPADPMDLDPKLAYHGPGFQQDLWRFPLYWQGNQSFLSRKRQRIY